MAARDDLYAGLTLEILDTIRRIRIETAFDDPNFLIGKGESVYSAFLRMLGIVEYSDAINQNIGIEKRIARGQTIVAQLLKPKNSEAELRRRLFASFLKSFLAQLEKYVRDVGLSKIKRIRKQIGPPVVDPRSDSRAPKVTFSGNIADDIKTVNNQIKQYSLQRDSIGQLVQEIDLLTAFTGNLNSVVRSVFKDISGNNPQPLGPAGGPFVSLIRSQTIGYSDRLDRLIDQRVFLNSELNYLERKMALIRTGEESLTGEPLSLLSIVDTLLYLFTEVSYTCKQCRFYQTQPLEVPAAALDPNLTEEQKAIEQKRLEEAQKRAEEIREARRQGAESGFCIYRAANLPTVKEGSCLSVWNLPGNDYWTASDNAEDGREDIVSLVKKKLNPRKR